MSNPKHTPEPFFYTPEGSETERAIFYIRDFKDQRLEAYVRLFAAAPDLLKVLQEAVECGMVPSSSVKDGGGHKYSQQVKVADKIRAVIARATGKEEQV